MSLAPAKKIVVANWKMNLDWSSASFLLESLSGTNFIQFVVCPPFVYLERVSRFSEFLFLEVGGQNCGMQLAGSYTGEVSACMLKDVGCKYVILGHSDRRSLYCEDETVIAKKVDCAIKAGITPIICVGETSLVRDQGKAVSFVLDQIAGSLFCDPSQSIIAYEPLWAIGSGVTPTLGAIEEMIKAIKGRYSGVRTLYGGSVSEENASAIFSLSGVDGVLVGASSLNVEKINKIIKASVEVA